MVTYYVVTKDKSFQAPNKVKQLLIARTLKKAGLKVATGTWTNKSESPVEFVKNLRKKLK